jgi:hypothetical protein
MKNINECILYTENNITEEEVLEVVNTYPLTSYIRNNKELYDDILWLLDKKELTYINFYKQKDYRTPNLIEVFSQFGIKLTGRENFVKMKGQTYIKVSLEII